MPAELDEQGRLELTLATLTAAEAASLVSVMLVEGAPMRDWWSRQAGSVLERFEDTLRSSMANGETSDQLVARVVGGTIKGEVVDGFMDIVRRDADALVRTGVAQVSNAARLATYEKNADVVKGVQQISTFDERTTDICIAYSNNAWLLPDYTPINGSRPWNGGPPRHWRCRSTTIPILKTFKELGFSAKEVPVGTRASMDGQVPANLSFDDWLRSKDRAFIDGVLGETKADLWMRGKMTLRQMVDMNGEALTSAELLSRYGP